MCDFAESVCKMMNNRGFQIKNAIDWKRFYGRFDLIISKKNDVYVRVDTEPNIARELVDFLPLKFQAQGLCHHIKRIWDGKIRLYNQMNGEIYLGLIPYIQEFAKETT